MQSPDHTAYIAAETAPSRSAPRRVSRYTLWGTTLAIAMLVAPPAVDSWAQGIQLVVVDVNAVAHGYQASKLIGTRVVNDKNESIGTIDDLIIIDAHDIVTILQVGSFLGIGGHLVAVPYESLAISDDGHKIVLAGASKDALKKLPEFQFRK
jgi:sporulation protein YlmC with PRC-barrel domain